MYKRQRLSFARKGVEKAIAFGAELILAVGGGSAIDTAKGIAIGAANPGTDIWEFWKNKKELKKALPVGTVLTISAAGSEMSNSAVLTDEETQDKDVYKRQGCEKELDVILKDPCPKCNGTGAKPGTTPETCSKCGGKGQVVYSQQSLFGMVQNVQTLSLIHI